MKIVDVNLFSFQAKREYKTMTAALGGVANYEGGVESSDFVIIEILTDQNITGYGEISDIPETLKMPSGNKFSIEELKKYLCNLLIGKDPFDIENILQPFPVEPMTDLRPDGTVYDIVANGIDNALLDLISKYVKKPVYSLLGGKKKDEVWVSWVAFIREIKYLEEEISEKVAEGFDAFKLKVGINPKEDEERLRIIRSVAGEKAIIKLDANSGWTLDEAVENLKNLEKYNPAGIETPIPYLDIEGKARLKKEIGIPIIEHVHTAEFAIDLIKNNAVDVFNISTVGAGGILKARRILSIAEAAGIPCLLGSTVEVGLGTAAQLHLASTSTQITWPSDLVGPKMYVNDVIQTPHTWKGNKLQVPQSIGLGVEISKDLINV